MALHVFPPDGDGPAALPGQPFPIEVRVCPTIDLESTAIYRRWPKGTTGPGRQCRYCERCFAYGDACLLVVPEVVSYPQAATYSTRDRGIDLTGA